MESDYHNVNSDRKVSFDENIYKQYQNKTKILLVDDSVDSGNSIKLSKEALKNYFSKAEIKTAVFNFMTKSTEKVDYYLYQNTMICGLWSNDSKENKKFNQLYNN